MSQDNSASLDSKVKVLYDYLISIGKVDSINMLTNFNIYETIEQKLKVEFDTTEMQKTLLGGLELLQLPTDNITMVMLMLQLPRQQMEMLLWMADNIKRGITKEQVMDKAQEIMNKR